MQWHHNIIYDMKIIWMQNLWNLVFINKILTKKSLENKLTKKQIMKYFINFLKYGTYIGNIKIPDDPRCYLENGKIKCDKFILESIKSLKYHELMKK